MTTYFNNERGFVLKGKVLCVVKAWVSYCKALHVIYFECLYCPPWTSYVSCSGLFDWTFNKLIYAYTLTWQGWAWANWTYFQYNRPKGGDVND